MIEIGRHGDHAQFYCYRATHNGDSRTGSGYWTKPGARHAAKVALKVLIGKSIRSRND